MVEIRYDRLSSIQGMQRQMVRLLDYLGSSKPPMVHFARMWEPAVDVYETEESIVVLVELAGVKQDRLEVVVEHREVRSLVALLHRVADKVQRVAVNCHYSLSFLHCFSPS